MLVEISQEFYYVWYESNNADIRHILFYNISYDNIALAGGLKLISLLLLDRKYGEYIILQISAPIHTAHWPNLYWKYYLHVSIKWDLL